MKKLVILAALLLIATSAYALGDNNNDNHNSLTSTMYGSDNDNRNTNINGADADSRSSSEATAIQGQMQGQGQAQGQGQLQGQAQVGNDTNVDVQGDKVEGSWAFSAPNMNAPSQSSPAQIYSLFGGISTQSTEEYVVCIEKLSVIERLGSMGVLTPEETKAEALAAFAQLKSITKDKRLLGILWRTNGRNLINGLGLLSWDACGVNIDSLGQVLTSPINAPTSTDVFNGRKDNYTAK